MERWEDELSCNMEATEEPTDDEKNLNRSVSNIEKLAPRASSMNN